MCVLQDSASERSESEQTADASQVQFDVTYLFFVSFACKYLAASQAFGAQQVTITIMCCVL